MLLEYGYRSWFTTASDGEGSILAMSPTESLRRLVEGAGIAFGLPLEVMRYGVLCL